MPIITTLKKREEKTPFQMDRKKKNDIERQYLLPTQRFEMKKINFRFRPKNALVIFNNLFS